MFKIGKIYNRRNDLHAIYGGQRQGGISTPSKHPIVFIFTSDSGQKYGYKDEFRTDGLFWYTGEGQTGEMKMNKGNLAILEHEKRRKKLFLFEYVKTAHVRFIGEAICVSHHYEERLDKDYNNRNVIIFHLALSSNNNDERVEEPKKSYSSIKRKLREEKLRELRIKSSVRTHTQSKKKEIIKNIIERSQAIKKYVLLRADGICEGCGKEAPFKSKNGPFLESHHVYRLSDGGPDDPQFVIALCPNCHREVHYGKDGNTYNKILIEKLKIIERNSL